MLICFDGFNFVQHKQLVSHILEKTNFLCHIYYLRKESCHTIDVDIGCIINPWSHKWNVMYAKFFYPK